jgi:hypothetical protein
MVSAEDGATTRRSLGDRHNPFASSAPKHKVKKTKSPEAAKPEDTTAGDAPTTGSGGGTQAPTTPTVPAQPTTTVPAGSIAVRWGAADGLDLPLGRLARGEALSAGEDPAVVFTGLKDHGKTAVFMVSEGLKPVGDGTCVPKDTCETLELKVGETEFFGYEGDPDATQFELDLVKIYTHDTKVPTSDVNSSSTGFGTGSGSTSSGATTASLKTRRLH